MFNLNGQSPVKDKALMFNLNGQSPVKDKALYVY